MIINKLEIPIVETEFVTPTDEEMLYLGAVCLAQSIHTNLGRAVDHHVNHYTHKPNKLNPIQLLDFGDVLTSEGFIYRKLSIKATEDLTDIGIVRNELTARSNTPKSGGNSVFWILGKDGEYINTEGQIIIETKKEELLKGWVTKNKLTSIFTPTPYGSIEKLILSE